MSSFTTRSGILSISTFPTSAPSPRRAADMQSSLSAKLASWSCSMVDGDALKASLTAWVNSEEEFGSFSDTSSEGEAGSDSESDAETVISSIFDSPPPSPRLVDSLSLPTVHSTSTSSLSCLNTIESTTATPISTHIPLSKAKLDWAAELTTPDSYFDTLPVFDDVVPLILTPTVSSDPAPLTTAPNLIVTPSTTRKFDFDWASEEETPASYFDAIPFQEVVAALTEVKKVISTPTTTTPILSKRFDFGFDWSSEDATPESYFLDIPVFDKIFVAPLDTPIAESATPSVQTTVEASQVTSVSGGESSPAADEEDDTDYFSTLPTWDDVPSTPILAKATLPALTPISPAKSVPLLTTNPEDPAEEYAFTFVDLPSLRKPLKMRPYSSGVSEHPQSLLRSAIGYSAWMKGLACHRV